MNKEDLFAWKLYDNNQYSMIPGVSSSKIFMDRNRLNLKTNSLNSTLVQNNISYNPIYQHHQDPIFDMK